MSCKIPVGIVVFKCDFSLHRVLRKGSIFDNHGEPVSMLIPQFLNYLLFGIKSVISDIGTYHK